jgi:hypothetical protein
MFAQRNLSTMKVLPISSMSQQTHIGSEREVGVHELAQHPTVNALR